MARRRLREDEVARPEQQSEHDPECGVPQMPVAQIAPAAVEQERRDQPVGVFDAQHAQLPCPLRKAVARRCRRRWYNHIRTDWIANAAIAVGNAHSAIASGLSSMPCWL